MRKLLLVLVIVSVAMPVCADTTTDLLDSAKSNYEANKYSKALDDLDWARKEIVKKQVETLKKYLPSNVQGFTQEDPSSASVMTMTSLNRRYSETSSGNSVEITVMTAGADSGMGAFMGMAATFAGMGQAENSSMIMSHGKRGTLIAEPTDNKFTATFSLAKSVVVTIESLGFGTDSEVKKFAELTDLAGLEKEFE